MDDVSEILNSLEKYLREVSHFLELNTHYTFSTLFDLPGEKHVLNKKALKWKIFSGKYKVSSSACLKNGKKEKTPRETFFEIATSKQGGAYLKRSWKNGYSTDRIEGGFAIYSHLMYDISVSSTRASFSGMVELRGHQNKSRFKFSIKKESSRGYKVTTLRSSHRQRQGQSLKQDIKKCTYKVTKI